MSDLAERFASADPEQRLGACRAAAECGDARWLGSLLQALGDPIPAIEAAASEALLRSAQRGEVVAELRRALHDREARRALAAALTLARIAPPDVGLLPALVRGLELSDRKRRWRAAKLLVETGRFHGEVLALMLQLADQHDDADVRRMVRYGLGALAPDDPHAAAALLAGTRDADPIARRAAFVALAALVDPPDAVIERLVQAEGSDEDEACRRIARITRERLATPLQKSSASSE